LTARPTLEQALQQDGVVNGEGLNKARAYSQSKGVPLERALTALSLADEERVWRSLSKASGLPFVDPGKAKVGDDLLAKVPPDQIEQNGALPVLVKNGVLYVAIDDPVKTFVADNLAFFAGCEVRCALAPPRALKDAIKRAVSGESQSSASGAAGRSAKAAGASSGTSGDPDAPIIKLVDKTITEAVDQRASDIHVEPFETTMRVRFRIDGVLREYQQMPRDLLGPLSSRLKILAGMDIAEKRKPQDGRIEFRVGGRAIDIRTSVLPSNHGETIVMRLLDKERNLLSLPALGFEGEDHDRFQSVIKRPNGIVLVTGPTGSGKTTTLYAATEPAQPQRRQDHHGRGSGRVQHRRDQPVSGPLQDRALVRAHPARDAAPGAEHHPRR
jgi:type IV pilus assembly protein PilB